MAALRVFLSLSVFLLLEHQTLANNSDPCLPSKWNNAYNIFVRRHIRSGMPNSYDKKEWKAYIEKNNDCDRPTQSFLKHLDLDRVKAVCTSGGGKVFRDNLCISHETFTFTTVRIDTETCNIRSVIRETKHLILACDLLPDGCLPVHFEGNPKSLRPDNNARDCQAPKTREDEKDQRLLVHSDVNLESVRSDNKATDCQDLKTGKDGKAQCLPGHSDKNQESLWSEKKTRDSQDLNTRENDEALTPVWLWALPSLLFGIFAKIVTFIIIVGLILFLLFLGSIFYVSRLFRFSTSARPAVQASL